MSVCVLVTSVENKLQAEMVMKSLFEKKLSACVHYFNVKTKYTWDGQILGDDEILMLIRTTEELYDEIYNLLNSIHPYEVPDITMFAADKVNELYLRWLNANVKSVDE